MKRFEGKVVMITGAASGIGFTTAIEFAREGARVIASDIDKENLDTAFSQDECAELSIDTLYHDVTDIAEWPNLLNDVVSTYGQLDVLFNNAGGGTFVTIEQATLEEWRDVNAVNLESVFFGMQAAISVMKDKGGVIINNSSIAAMVAEPRLAAYSATKGGVRSMTKVAAVDCARKGYPIRINSIHPGYTETKLVAAAMAFLGDEAEEFATNSIRAIPMGRLAQPIEIARPVLFLASDDASYMTGAELVIDGGYIAA